ncbi:MAG: cytochrome c family protein [Deltaproteobacteria bacterium]|nr:cytochrome c family protein [Deltaproteobacteria bacterium]
MVKGKPLLRRAGFLVVCIAVSLYVISAQGGEEPAKLVKAPEAGRPDLIKIDTLAAYGKLELPPVTFFHDKHTEVLLKEKKTCQTCHSMDNGKLSLVFKRQGTMKPEQIKDTYHQYCISCHMETAAAGKPSGPPDGLCRGCHNAEPPQPLRLDAGLDKVAHFRHVDSKQIPAAAGAKDNCASCHHELDKKTDKLVYAKGKEETCRDCHKAKPKNDVKSLEQAAHQQCVLCHLDLANKGVKDNGPYQCAGCHSEAGQALVAKKNQEVLAGLPGHEVPRLMRGQPDAALITPKLEEGKPAKSELMEPVAFDHKAHEKFNNNCRVCHHEGMQACEDCHTLGGSKEGGMVTMEKAMHSLKSQHSCIGCHTAKQASPKCAGCHNHIKKVSKPEDANCTLCHIPGCLQGAGTIGEKLFCLLKPQKASLAESILKSRKMKVGTYAETDIPDKVVIKDLSDQYKPAEFTHRKHVLDLMKGMKGNQLAEYFHHDPGTICQACHHYSPPSKNPPTCLSCHSDKSKQVREGNRPALLAAQHQQCMSCHTDMKLAKPAATACTECHQEKKK